MYVMITVDKIISNFPKIVELALNNTMNSKLIILAD